MTKENKIIELEENALEQITGGVHTKRNRSKTHGGSRKPANMKKKTKGLLTCPKCGEEKLPHRVCPNCGYYDGKDVHI